MQSIQNDDNNFICEISAPCFQKLLPKERDWIQKSKTQLLFRKGENLTKQGAFASYLLFIIDGVVKQYIEGDNNKSYILKLLQSGDFIGLTVAFNENTYAYSTVALRDTRAYLIEKEAMTTLLKQNNGFAHSIMYRHLEHEAKMYQSIHHLMFKQMPGRLADTLIYLSSELFNSENIFSMLTRKDIADIAGISTESAVKLLKAWEKEGIIQLSEKEVNIIQPELLKEISKRG